MDKDTDFFNFHPDKIKVVGIIAVGRSSSLFLQCLLDGHPNLITFPMKEFVRLDSKDNFSAFFDKYYNNILREDFKLYNQNIDDCLKKKEFEKCVKDYLDNFGYNTKTFFIALHYAAAKSNKQNIKKIEYIVYQSHNASYTKELFKEFKNIKFVFTIRDPRANHWSWIKNENAPDLYMYQLYYYVLYKKLKFCSIAIKHEDIHLRHPYVKRKIISFLKIKDNVCLNNSTICNRPFTGSIIGSKIKGDRPNPRYVNDKWKTDLPKYEIDRIQRIFSEFMSEFEYKNINTKGLENFITVYGHKYYFKSIRFSPLKNILDFFTKIPLVGLWVPKIIFFTYFIWTHIDERSKVLLFFPKKR